MTQLVQQVDPARLVANTKALIASELPNGLEGPRAQLVSMMLDHPQIDVTIDPVLPGRPNVIGRIRGAGRVPGLLLNAHLDSAFVDVDQWNHPPQQAWEADGRIFGGGVSDMLGGLAAMIEAMLALSAGEPPPGDVALLVSMHHDSNGVGTKYALANHDDWPTQAINGEPTGLTISSAHGGCIKFEVTFAGRSAHVSQIGDGRDALTQPSNSSPTSRLQASWPNPMSDCPACLDSRSGWSTVARSRAWCPRGHSSVATCAPYRA